MATLADSLVSSSSRKLPIRMRPDLRARQHRYQGRVYWVVKDPVGLQYYRFEEEEFAILQMLDGDSSLDEIAHGFERDFPPQTIRIEELQQFVGHLHRSNLVITDAAGQGIQLRKRRDERKSKERWATLSNVLSIRFKGIDPERILNFLYSLGPVRWFFSVPAVVCWCLLALSALVLVIVQFDVFQSRLPSFHTFFAAQNWLWLGLTLCVTKVLHEFGHGLSCKHFGGECHEMGVMFLVLTPCLYCNVSDSWMLPNRWHRAAIGAAGMYVELYLASIATFIWWFTEPGPLNYICLNVMFISSVSTILFNANPLLKYDGYYILSDVLEIPNLRQKSSQILNRKLGKWCLGLEEPEDPFLPKRNQLIFALYTVASSIYRWVVVLSILYFLNKVFEPYGLKIIGQLIALGACYGLVVQPLVKVYKFFKVPGRLGKVKRWRMYVTMLLLAAVIGAVLVVPLPSHVYSSLEVQARDAESVYVKVQGGVLEEVLVKPGQRVERDQPLAQLSDINIDLAITKLTGEREVYSTQLESLHSMSFDQPETASRIDEVTKSLQTVEEQLVHLEDDRRMLTLRAPRAGTVLPPTLVPDESSADAQLPAWSGSPLEPKNLGATLLLGTLVCQIGDPNNLEARLVIDQADIDLVAAGQRVEIMLAQSADFVYVSQIGRRSSEDLRISPTRLSSLQGGDLPTKMDAGGVPRPLSPVFGALVPLPEEDPHGLLRIGLVGRAKITTAPRTLWDRISRYVARTFNFEL
jgi:putative peptide zinc metalloprotease protein